MAADRLPPQLEEVKAGDRLEFIRTVNINGVFYRKKKMAYVLDVDESVALVAFVRPLRDIHNNQRKDYTFRWGGFRFCRFIEPGELISNCRKLD